MKDKYVVIIIFDLSIAFDTVHEIISLPKLYSELNRVERLLSDIQTRKIVQNCCFRIKKSEYPKEQEPDT